MEGNGNGDSTGSGKKTMVAIDQSERSYYALKWTLENIQESITNSLVLFMVQPPPKTNNLFAIASHLGMFFNASPKCLIPAPDFSERHRLVSVGILDKAKSICNGYGVNAETVMVIGDAKEAICDAVQKLDINMLVLGDHGEGTIKRAILGSVTNYCALNVKCSVLIVKKPESTNM